MLITKDMLASKGAKQELLDEFDKECPNGFDLSKPYRQIPGFIREGALAFAFQYTGICTQEWLYNNVRQTNYVGGLRHNLPNGNPAVIYFNRATSTLHRVKFYFNGTVSNPLKNIPASIYYYKNGNIKLREFYENGERQDPSYMIPAVAAYFENGKYEYIKHYKNGITRAPRAGVPAIIEFNNDGSIRAQYDENYNTFMFP